MLGESAEPEKKVKELSPHALVSGKLVTARLVLSEHTQLHPNLLLPLEDNAHFQGVTGIVEQVPAWDEGTQRYTGWLTLRDTDGDIVLRKTLGEQLHNFGPLPGDTQDSWGAVRLVLNAASQPQMPS